MQRKRLILYGIRTLEMPFIWSTASHHTLTNLIEHFLAVRELIHLMNQLRDRYFSMPTTSFIKASLGMQMGKFGTTLDENDLPNQPFIATAMTGAWMATWSGLTSRCDGCHSLSLQNSFWKDGDHVG